MTENTNNDELNKLINELPKTFYKDYDESNIYKDQTNDTVKKIFIEDILKVFKDLLSLDYMKSVYDNFKKLKDIVKKLYNLTSTNAATRTADENLQLDTTQIRTDQDVYKFFDDLFKHLYNNIIKFMIEKKLELPRDLDGRIEDKITRMAQHMNEYNNMKTKLNSLYGRTDAILAKSFIENTQLGRKSKSNTEIIESLSISIGNISIIDFSSLDKTKIDGTLSRFDRLIGLIETIELYKKDNSLKEEEKNEFFIPEIYKIKTKDSTNKYYSLHYYIAIYIKLLDILSNIKNNIEDKNIKKIIKKIENKIEINISNKLTSLKKRNVNLSNFKLNNEHPFLKKIPVMSGGKSSNFIMTGGNAILFTRIKHDKLQRILTNVYNNLADNLKPEFMKDYNHLINQTPPASIKKFIDLASNYIDSSLRKDKTLFDMYERQFRELFGNYVYMYYTFKTFIPIYILLTFVSYKSNLDNEIVELNKKYNLIIKGIKNNLNLGIENYTTILKSHVYLNKDEHIEITDEQNPFIINIPNNKYKEIYEKITDFREKLKNIQDNDGYKTLLIKYINYLKELFQNDKYKIITRDEDRQKIFYFESAEGYISLPEKNSDINSYRDIWTDYTDEPQIDSDDGRLKINNNFSYLFKPIDIPVLENNPKSIIMEILNNSQLIDELYDKYILFIYLGFHHHLYRDDNPKDYIARHFSVEDLNKSFSEDDFNLKFAETLIPTKNKQNKNSNVIIFNTITNESYTVKLSDGGKTFYHDDENKDQNAEDLRKEADETAATAKEAAAAAFGAALGSAMIEDSAAKDVKDRAKAWAEKWEEKWEDAAAAAADADAAAAGDGPQYASFDAKKEFKDVVRNIIRLSKISEKKGILNTSISEKIKNLNIEDDLRKTKVIDIKNKIPQYSEICKNIYISYISLFKESKKLDNEIGNIISEKNIPIDKILLNLSMFMIIGLIILAIIKKMAITQEAYKEYQSLNEILYLHKFIINEEDTVKKYKLKADEDKEYIKELESKLYELGYNIQTLDIEKIMKELKLKKQAADLKYKISDESSYKIRVKELEAIASRVFSLDKDTDDHYIDIIGTLLIIMFFTYFIYITISLISS